MANGQNILLKIGIRILLIGGFLIGFNKLYKRFFWQEDLVKHGPMLDNLIQLQDTCDVIYFGESSNFTTHPDDTDKSRISDIIALEFPDHKFGTINHGAYHIGMFLPLVRQIPQSVPVKTIIITMNLRTFNQDVIFGPDEARLRLASRFYQPMPSILNKTLASLNYYDNRSGHERDILKWNSWTYDTLQSSIDSIRFNKNTIRRWCEVPKFVDSSGKQDDAKRQLADQYIKAYAFQLDSQNQMVKEFDELVNVANRKNLRLVINIIPENVEDAGYYIGSNLVWLMQKNRDFLVQRYENKDVIVVDNLEILTGNHFIDRASIPQEHYDFNGRKAIGQRVAKAIISLSD
jgi:hypothetical protein